MMIASRHATVPTTKDQIITDPLSINSVKIEEIKKKKQIDPKRDLPDRRDKSGAQVVKKKQKRTGTSLR
jgi:hypothetical protein